MFYTLKTIFIMLRLMQIMAYEPAAFDLHDFRPDKSSGISEEEIAKKQIVIAPGLVFNAVIEVTSKGNGILKIVNLKKVKVYDGHDDGDVYRNMLLTIKFADFDGDGYRDLVIYGIIDFYSDDDRRREKAQESRPAILLYRFNPQKQEFEEKFIYAPTWYDLYDKKK